MFACTCNSCTWHVCLLARAHPDSQSCTHNHRHSPNQPRVQGQCNTYIPNNSTIAMTRLLWAVQYFVANGFYVVVGGRQGADLHRGGWGVRGSGSARSGLGGGRQGLAESGLGSGRQGLTQSGLGSGTVGGREEETPVHTHHCTHFYAQHPLHRPLPCLTVCCPCPCTPPPSAVPPPSPPTALQLDYHPDPADRLPLDPPAYATAWLRLWATLTCLPNFSSALRHRVLLDLLNEPGRLAGGAGLRWARWVWRRGLA